MNFSDNEKTFIGSLYEITQENMYYVLNYQDWVKGEVIHSIFKGDKFMVLDCKRGKDSSAADAILWVEILIGDIVGYICVYPWTIENFTLLQQSGKLRNRNNNDKPSSR